MIYLDNAATTLHKPPQVIDAVVRAMTGMRNKTAKAREIKVFSGLILCFPLYFRFIKAPAHS